MSRIKVLDSITANKIKAGEVIERPVSVVKELFDNSVDAGASQIKIEINNGGISLIRVTDNGIGMDSEDARKAFIVHATSKITSLEDIYDLSTQGFRGEALASIATCSKTTLITKTSDSDVGTKVIFEDGKLVSANEVGASSGTSVSVENLFSNTPARYKFLKKDATEGMYILSLVEKLAIINPQVNVRLIKDGKEILSTPGNSNMLDTIYSIYGKQTASELVKLDYEIDGYKIRGYTSSPSLSRGNRALQCFFVNDRIVKSTTITAAVDEAYRNICMKGRFPICFLCIYVPPHMLDVNVHPQKSEVRFTSDSNVFSLVYHGLKDVVTKDEKSPSLMDVISDEADREVAQASIKSTYSNPISTNIKPGYAPTQMKYSSSSIVPSKPTEETSKACQTMFEILSEIKCEDANKGKEDESATNAVEPNPVIVQDKQVLSDFEELCEAKFVGIIFDTYIIMQSDSHVFFIDQHAAHERVLYERFLKTKSQSKDLLVQTLLVPQIISFGISDYEFISENAKGFQAHGFDIELLEDHQIAVRSVPVGVGNNIKELIDIVVAELKRDVPKGNDAWFMSIATAACKAAVKGHDKLNTTEVEALLEQMKELADPYHCPHGRPTFIKNSNRDFEKSFKRIV